MKKDVNYKYNIGDEVYYHNTCIWIKEKVVDRTYHPHPIYPSTPLYKLEGQGDALVPEDILYTKEEKLKARPYRGRLY